MPTATVQTTQDEVMLADGVTVRIRPVRPDDAAALAELYGGCSARSRYLRLHSCRQRLCSGEAELMAAADGTGRIALVGTVDGRLVADGRVEPLQGGNCEA